MGLETPQKYGTNIKFDRLENHFNQTFRMGFSIKDKKLSHVNRGASSTKPVDGAGGAAGLDTMAEARLMDERLRV